MPKAPAFVAKPALDKVPLAIRKDIRDKYDSEKEDFESTISELLGVSFHLKINAAEILPYWPESNSSFGSMLKSYVEGFVSALKDYIEKFGDEGKGAFNDAVAKNQLTLNVNELGDKGTTISADVKDGVFRILFNHQSLGYNTSQISDYLLKAVESVPRAGFSVVAKTSIDKFNADIVDIASEIGTILAMPDVVLDPNFEENYAALAVKTDTNWHKNFGQVVQAYFEGLKDQLTSQGFKEDSMLQEGLAELLTSKTFKVRIVNKTKYTVETVLEGGVVYFQTTADNWWYNASEAGKDLVKLL